MNKALIIASALVLGSSSVAMADSFSFGARASVSWQTRAPVIVRDHRTPTYREPVYQRYTSNDYRWERHQPAPIPANLDCRNWDPTVDTNDPCNVYSSGFTYAPVMRGPWTLLGVRESSVPVGQFITVNDGRTFGVLKLRAEQGNPVITKVAVSFMDGSTQVLNLGGYLQSGTTRTVRLDHHRAVNQIVIYTANGSRGTYSIAAL